LQPLSITLIAFNRFELASGALNALLKLLLQYFAISAVPSSALKSLSYRFPMRAFKSLAKRFQ
jgi:hypothetical protein